MKNHELAMNVLIDLEEEKGKLEKEIARLENEIKRCSGMLKNPGFVNKAPEAKVNAEKNIVLRRKSKNKLMSHILNICPNCVTIKSTITREMEGIKMKKANIINLIKYHAERNDSAFRNEAYQIANEFDKNGDYQLAEYIMALLSNANTFVPQMEEDDLAFVKKLEVNGDPLPLPDCIKDDIVGIVNAAGHGIGVNKFLFQGAPGTGKTESVKQIARILDRELYMVDFAFLIDSKLGQTAKNIAQLFDEINGLFSPEKVVVLFDEIDALALDRTDSNDLREMGRATTSVLKGLDNLNDEVLLIATTNLFNHFDKAIVRRFDSVIDFNRYSHEDLVDISEIILKHYLSKFKDVGSNMRLFRKIISSVDPIPYPGDLKNIIRTSLAFSNPNDEFDYLRRVYRSFYKEDIKDLKHLQSQGFTVREIEILTGISKSQVQRELKE